MLWLHYDTRWTQSTGNGSPFQKAHISCRSVIIRGSPSDDLKLQGCLLRMNETVEKGL